MSLFISSLNSGSNGNCYYISNGTDAILIDGGLSCRETEKRLKRIGSSLKHIKAIFVSHEHGDHIHGVNGICKKFKVPVFLSKGTFENGGLRVDQQFVNIIDSDSYTQIGGLSIKGFQKIHDARDPHSFIVEGAGVKVGIFTDIGTACKNVVTQFRECHAAFLEANYDEDLLEQGSYPWALKARIRGGKGHLSNRQAFQLFMEHRPHFMTHLILSHLSKDNNRPKLVRDLFATANYSTEVIIASRERETKIFHIRQSSTRRFFPSRPVVERSQLSLF